MSDLDERIRGALSGLRQAPIPKVPRIRPAAPERRATLPALLAAALMLLALAGSLITLPSRNRGLAAAGVTARIDALEGRIAKIENEVLRTLMSRELALLRRELDLAQSGD
jgi:hypothetical protein